MLREFINSKNPHLSQPNKSIDMYSNSTKQELPPCGSSPSATANKTIQFNKRFMTIQKDGREMRIALFLIKIYEILMRNEYSGIITWTNSGASFMILDTAQLEKKILPRLFTHCSFSSFQRQLNAYGFKKALHNSKVFTYKNENFIRGKVMMLAKIERKTWNAGRIANLMRNSYTLVSNELGTIKSLYEALSGKANCIEWGNILNLLEFPQAPNQEREKPVLKSKNDFPEMTMKMEETQSQKSELN
jgi:hypothetical protein